MFTMIKLTIITIVVLLVSVAHYSIAIETAEDELIHSLLAKVRSMEVEVMTSSDIRSRRQVKDPPVAAKYSGASAVSYIRWGNSTCGPEATTMYSGYAAGGYYTHKGSPANLLCLPPDPQYYSPSSSGSQYIYGVEYEISGVNNHAHDRNMPCALCLAVGRSTMVMIPSHYECPSGWYKEYDGYIMSKYHGYEGSSMYNCVDKYLEQIPGSGGSQTGHEIHTVYAVCGHYFPCSSTEMTCVVCTM